MSVALTFNASDTSTARAELEECWRKQDAQALFDRCFEDDVNASIFLKVMRCLNHSWFTPKAHSQLWRDLAAQLKLYDRPSKDLLFNSSFFPGNGLSESACSSVDGQAFAYLTHAAIGLEEIGERQRLTRESFVAALEKGPNKAEPFFINLISFHPYQARSIPIDQEDDLFRNKSLRLLEMDAEYIYVLAEASGDYKELIRLSLNGATDNRTHLRLRFPSHCLHLSLERARMWYVDLETKELIEASLEGAHITSTPLSLPEDLGLLQLHELTVSDDGSSIFLSINNRFQDSRFVFAVAQRLSEAPTGDAPWSIRWFRRKDLRGAKFLTSSTVGPCYDSSGQQNNGGAFYCLDISGQLFCIDPHRLRVSEVDLNSCDGNKVLQPLQRIAVENPSSFSFVTLAKHLPLAASYSMKTNSIQVWDIARKTRLLELACPYHVGAMFFTHDDRILVTVERSMGCRNGIVAASFLDYALLVGKPPVHFSAQDYVRLQPLIAAFPDNPELHILKCLVGYFATSLNSTNELASASAKEA